ncbi:DUF998 domain-containing protein [Hyphobacterium sp.]|uniref:DUF998 domain-containing protein n=1 Tax=Hyphobacterium sp. TaxID=2004662 RepID=UPI003BA92293
MKRMLILAGLIGATLFLIGIFVVGAMAENYDPLSQFVSELGAVGAPNAWLLNGLVLAPAGSLIALGGLGRLGQGEWLSGPLVSLSGTGFLIAGIYRCDAGCGFVDMSPAAMIHNQAAFGAFLLAILAALILTVVSLARRNGSRAAINAIAVTGMVAGLGAMMTIGLDHPLIGLSQRVFLVSFCLWLMVDSAVLLRTPRKARA